jgi:uncharacterized membrane protein
MIDDKIEDGYSEEDAIKEIGSIDDVVESILAETSFIKIAKQRLKPTRRFSSLEVVLLALGSPLWISLLVAFFACVLAVYVSLLSVAISVWAVFISLCAVSVSGVLIGLIFAIVKNIYTGITIIDLTIVCFGLAILLFYCCKWLTKWTFVLPKKFILSAKKRMSKREEYNENAI